MTPLALSIRPVSFALRNELMAPKPSRRGTVPRLKMNMESAPAYQLPVPSAYTCMVWSGPHGMSPFKRPTTKGPRPAAAALILPSRIPGKRTRSRESHGKIPRMRTPRNSMKAPAMMGITPFRAVERLKSEPRAPTSPPITV